MAMSDKQFVAMVFNPALEFGETIPKIEGRPWDEDIGRLRNYVMRLLPQETIAYLWERVQVLEEVHSDQTKYLHELAESIRIPTTPRIERLMRAAMRKVD